jgi:hypothetical protein
MLVFVAASGIHSQGSWGSMTQLGLGRHTLLNTVLLGTTLALLLLNTLDTLIEMVFGGGTLGRVLALC